MGNEFRSLVSSVSLFMAIPGDSGVMIWCGVIGEDDLIIDFIDSDDTGVFGNMISFALTFVWRACGCDSMYTIISSIT